MTDKEFWEKCGFAALEYLDFNGKVCGVHYVSPDKTWGKAWYPLIDLEHIGLLFKYAVPNIPMLLHIKLKPKRPGFPYLAEIMLFTEGNIRSYYGESYEDYAQALKLAIWEVIRGKGE